MYVVYVFYVLKATVSACLSLVRLVRRCSFCLVLSLVITEQIKCCWWW